MPSGPKKRFANRAPRGAAALEAAIVLSACAVLLLGALEMSLLVVRSNVLAHSARRLAREVVTHGELAAACGGCWGATPVSVAADADHPAALAVSPWLTTMNPSDVAISITWIDGDNAPESRVLVTLAYTHQSVVPLVSWYGDREIVARSQQRITH